MPADQQGSIWIEEGGTRYQWHRRLENGVVSLYVGNLLPISTLNSAMVPEIIARLLLQE